jgi:hypothetical protein
MNHGDSIRFIHSRSPQKIKQCIQEIFKFPLGSQLMMASQSYDFCS